MRHWQVKLGYEQYRCYTAAQYLREPKAESLCVMREALAGGARWVGREFVYLLWGPMWPWRWVT